MSTQKFLSEFVDGGQGCSRDDCMVEILSSHTTLVHYPETYNMQNVSINSNKNVSITTKYCKSCGKRWSES